MFPSRWKSFSMTSAEREYMALLSFLPLKTYRKIPRFLRYSLQIERQLETAQGLIGHSLQAQILRREFWTLSVWVDETSLMSFVNHAPHAGIMDSLAPHMGNTRFVRWKVKGSELPLKWQEAKRRYYDQVNPAL
jgi:hypothetical protein